MGIIAPETKEIVTPPADTPVNPPTENAPPATPPPSSPPAETADQKATRLEKELQARDTKINDLATTIATIEQRQRTLETHAPKDDEIQKELEAIEELRMTDPLAATKKNADLLRKISDSSTQRAQGAMAYQAVVDKLRTGVKSANPDFDDEVVDYVMERADKLATTGKFKTAEEAVNAAVTLVKSKFDGYAQKRNATPPLPPGAVVETGGNPPPAPAKKDDALPSASEEIGQRKEALQKKIL